MISIPSTARPRRKSSEGIRSEKEVGETNSFDAFIGSKIDEDGKIKKSFAKRKNLTAFPRVDMTG